MIKIENLKLDIEKLDGVYYFEARRFKTIEQVIVYYYKKLGFNAIYTENKFWIEFYNLFFNNMEVEVINGENILKFNFEKTTDLKKIFNKKIMFLHNLYYNFSAKDLKIPLKYLETDDVLKILYYLKIEKTGFPDVMIYDSKDLFFVEIKSQNDNLRDSQAQTLLFLKLNNVDVRLCTINFSENKIKNTLNKIENVLDETIEINKFFSDIIKLKYREKFWYEKGYGIFLMLTLGFIFIPIILISILKNNLEEESRVKQEINRILKKRNAGVSLK